MASSPQASRARSQGGSCLRRSRVWQWGVARAAHQLNGAGSLTTDECRWAGERHRSMFGLGNTRRPNQSECRPTVGPRASNPMTTGSNPATRSIPSVVSTQHAGPLTRVVVVQSPPRGTNGHVAQSGRGNGFLACPVAVRVRPWSPSARGAVGRRRTFRPFRSGFDSHRSGPS